MYRIILHSYTVHHHTPGNSRSHRTISRVCTHTYCSSVCLSNITYSSTSPDYKYMHCSLAVRLRCVHGAASQAFVACCRNADFQVPCVAPFSAVLDGGCTIYNVNSWHARDTCNLVVDSCGVRRACSPTRHKSNSLSFFHTERSTHTCARVLVGLA